jgi:ubiquinone/menaquinone biosynthesis C-methylase UbiE
VNVVPLIILDYIIPFPYHSEMNNFAERMTEILNSGALNIALALGYRNRIFDILEEMNKPVLIAELASASGLNERYLREWLGIMVTGGILELFSASGAEDRYFLPPEHAALLTRRAGSGNLGVYTQEIPLLTSCAMEFVNAGFTSGEGVPFSKYPDFQRFMGELSNAKHEKELISVFLPSVDNGGLVDRLTEGIEVCDLGCGQGVAVNLMAEAFPDSRFTGIDNHEEAIRTAEKSARDMGLNNISYRILDAAKIHLMDEFTNRFDYITAFDAIHDQSHPAEVLKGVRHMLSPGGLFSMVDIKASSNHSDNIDHPMGPFLYTVSLLHCMPIGLNDKGDGHGMMWGTQKAEELLKEAGFEHIEIAEMDFDSFNVHFLCRVPIS